MGPVSLIHPVRLFVSDLDGTVLPLGGGDGARRFADWWRALPPSVRPLICYNSGRLCRDVRATAARAGLPPADYVIGGVGTSLVGADGRRLPGFQRRFRDGWDVAAVRAVMARFAGVEPQPARFQGAYKSSWFLRRAEPGRVAEIGEALAAVSLRVRVIYSSGRDLDILPAEAGKGSALVWLCERLGFSAHEVVVAGDTENDLTMFQVPGVRAIAVANALPGLLSRLDGCQVHLAGAPDADGVIEGLTRFGLNPAGGRSSV